MCVPSVIEREKKIKLSISATWNAKYDVFSAWFYWIAWYGFYVIIDNLRRPQILNLIITFFSLSENLSYGFDNTKRKNKENMMHGYCVTIFYSYKNYDLIKTADEKFISHSNKLKHFALFHICSFLAWI